MGDVKVVSVSAAQHTAQAPLAIEEESGAGRGEGGGGGGAPPAAEAAVVGVSAVTVEAAAQTEMAVVAGGKGGSEERMVVLKVATRSGMAATENGECVTSDADREAETETGKTRQTPSVATGVKDARADGDHDDDERREESVAKATADAARLAETEGEVESDGVAVSPTPAARPQKRSRRAIQATKTAAAAEGNAVRDDEEEDDDAAVTSVEDAQSPEIICIDSDENDDTQNEDVETVTSEMSAVEDVDNGRAQGSRRRKKRARVLGFSSAKGRGHHKHKRRHLSIVADDGSDRLDVAAPPSRARRQQSVGNADAELAPNPDSLDAPLIAPSSSHAFDWSTLNDCMQPLVQKNMDELARLRQESADIVVANCATWGKMRCIEHNDAFIASMEADQTENAQQMRIQSVRRGRFYQDAWEEEDFLASQDRPAVNGRSGKKRPFAGCAAIVSNQELVRGYDDTQYRDYIARLEARAALPPKQAVAVCHVAASPVRRPRHARRPASDMDTLPPVAVRDTHPASCGTWKLKGKDGPSYDSIHPASMRAAKISTRWEEERDRDPAEVEQLPDPGLRRSSRREGKQDDTASIASAEDDDASTATVDKPVSDEVVELPSFGLIVEDDEVSRELDNSLVRLLELAALNWRRIQTVYERAITGIAVAPLMEAERAAEERLEHLYKTLYPTNPDQADLDEQMPRELKLTSKPRDLVAFATRSCTSSAESAAVGASVEYAVRLQKGEPIDVLDRNGCWNDAVVTDLLQEAGKGMKYVLVSYALRGDDSPEWISVIEGRILPRGVADGRVLFTLGQTRAHRRLELNTSIADLLQGTFPARQSTHRVVPIGGGGDGGNDPNGDGRGAKSSSKKKQRR